MPVLALRNLWQVLLRHPPTIVRRETGHGLFMAVRRGIGDKVGELWKEEIGEETAE